MSRNSIKIAEVSGEGAAASRLHLLRRELAGGAVAAILAVPVSVGFGLFAFAPLGDAMRDAAVTAALVSACVVPLVCIALGSSTGLVYAPRSVISFMVAAVAIQGLLASPILVRELPAQEAALAYVVVALLVSGFAQAAAGVMRLGAAVKYVPFPVMAGFQNSAAALLLVAQIAPLLGLARAAPLSSPADWLRGADWRTALVGAVAFALAWYGARITKRLPAPALGLLGGTLVYHLLALGGWRPSGGMVISAALPMPSLDTLGYVPTVLQRLDFIDLLALTIAALGVAIVASMDTLLCTRVVEQKTGVRSDSSNELLRIGIGNAGAACLGGIPSGVQVGASLGSHAAGGTGRVSMLFAAAVAGIVLVWLQPLLALLPAAVIAGLLLVISLQLFDKWTLQAIGKLLSGRLQNWRATLLDLALMGVVAFLALAVHIVLAVLSGFVIAIAVFFMRMSRPIMRRTYRCDVVRSRRLRAPDENALLARAAGGVLVIELEGALFFGSSENLAARIAAAAREGVQTVILDMRHVTDIDSTGARVIIDLREAMARRGVQIALAHIPPGSALRGTLADAGILLALGDERLFHDVDAAIEWAEERILAATSAKAAAGEKPLEALDLFSGLSAADLERVRPLLERCAYRKGEAVIREGEPDRRLFVIASGRATARVRAGTPPRDIRLTTFSPGVAIGELALLDERARSASVVAEEDMICWVLSQEAFERLQAAAPQLALRLLANLAREMALRLRHANRTICELDA